MALLQRHPLDWGAATPGHVGRDLLVGLAAVQPRSREGRRDTRRHLSNSLVAGLAHRRHSARRGWRDRVEAAEGLAAHVHPIEIGRIVDEHAATRQIDDRDDLQSEERHHPGPGRGGGETAVDTKVVVVGGAERRDTLGRGGLDCRFGSVERGEVGRQVDVRIDDRPARSLVRVATQAMPVVHASLRPMPPGAFPSSSATTKGRACHACQRLAPALSLGFGSLRLVAAAILRARESAIKPLLGRAAGSATRSGGSMDCDRLPTLI